MSYGKNKAKVWYNNGVIEGMYDNPPAGWEKGRLTEKKKSAVSLRDRAAEKGFNRPQRKS